MIMVATPTINRLQKTLQKKQQHLQKQYCCVCLAGCNFRDRVIATSVIRRLLTMNQSKPWLKKSKNDTRMRFFTPSRVFSNYHI
jgi:hypothetical protein